MFRRRSFLIGCSSLAVAPAMAGTASFAAFTSTTTEPPAAAIAAEADPFELRMAGWETTAAPGTHDAAMWVQVSSSWQVAWR